MVRDPRSFSGCYSRNIKGTQARPQEQHFDDIVAVCFAEDLDADLIATRNLCMAPLGSGAVADDTRYSGSTGCVWISSDTWFACQPCGYL